MQSDESSYHFGMHFRQQSHLAQTLAFGVIHIALAITIGWLLSGSFVFGTLLALLEPVCNTVVTHQIGKVFRHGPAGTRRALLRSALIGVAHLMVAVVLAKLLMGSFVSAWAYALLEPLANTVAHYFFTRWWHRRPAPVSSQIDAEPTTGGVFIPGASYP